MNYLEVYNKIVAHAKQRNTVKGGSTIVETHHIIPTHCNGSNLKENKVNLTLREHFVCHVLLAKIYKGTQFHAGMCRATVAMNQRSGVSSRLYQSIRGQHISNLKNQVISKKQKQAISQANKGNKSRTGHKNTPEHVEILRQSRIGSKHSDETKAGWSEQRKGKTPWNKGMTGFSISYPDTRKSSGPASAEKKLKIGLANRGKTRSEESKEKMRQAWLKRKQKELINVS